MNTLLVKGGCGHSDKQIESGSISFCACFITALLIIGVMAL